MKKTFFSFLFLMVFITGVSFAEGLKYTVRGGMNFDVTTNFRYLSADVNADVFFENIPGIEKFMNYNKITIRPYVGVQLLPMAFRLDDAHSSGYYGLSPKLYSKFSQEWRKFRI